MDRRGGFSLVELLVVITIIAILIAMLLPAVQVAREAGRRIQCANNLKQIGLAVTGYEDVHKYLPAGAYTYDSNSDAAVFPGHNIYRGSVLIRTLPFLEQQTLYDHYDFVKTTDYQKYPGTSKYLNATVIPLYRCPSDSPALPVSTTGFATTNYFASMGPTRVAENAAAPCPLYTTWNLVCRLSESSGANTPNAGPFKRQCYHCPLSVITDGLSNTIFFGESRPRCNTHAWMGWGGSNSGQGLCCTEIPINYDSCESSYSESLANGCRCNTNWSSAFGFKSCHPNGAQFLFGDGTVHWLPESIDHQTYQYLGDMADGKTVPWTW